MTNENHPLPKHIYDAFEEIDAALFTGDTFNDWKCNEWFRSYMERWQRNVPDIPMIIENWAVIIVGAFDGYSPPEHQSRKITGNIFNNPKFEDGTIVTTSRILEVISSHKVRTVSGSVYTLGDPDPKYLSIYPQAANGVKNVV